jgi:hypothetical protein
MKCIACFFEDEFQKQLKKKCFGIPRFENKLIRYKELYLESLSQLHSVKNCTCEFANNNPTYISWTDDFLHNLQSNTQIVKNTFDELTDIYLTYISRSNKVSLDKFWSFLSKNDLLGSSESALTYTRLLFRARPNDKTFSPTDIKALFHIPFDRRDLIGNQRFSITGQPMVYLSNSVLSVEKELETPLTDLVFAGFLPKYYQYYVQKIYEIKNSIFNLLTKSLPAITETGNISYYHEHLTPNYKSIVVDIRKSILSHVLTFPTEIKGRFIAEYVLPQMITTSLLEHDYKGIIYPSTKDFSSFVYNKLNNEHEMNIALFVDYNKSQDIDTILLDSFFKFTFDGSETYTTTITDVRNRFESIFQRNREPKQNNNDFILPLVHTEMHLKNLESAKLRGEYYFDTEHGKIELEFYMKMADELDRYVR